VLQYTEPFPLSQTLLFNRKTDMSWLDYSSYVEYIYLEIIKATERLISVTLV